MPVFSVNFCIFNLSNISLPLTTNFNGEFLILVGLFEKNSFICFLASLSMVLSVCSRDERLFLSISIRLFLYCDFSNRVYFF